MERTVNTAFFPALIIAPASPSHCYSVLFPDLPGCVSAGDSVTHAFEMAMEALAMHLGGMAEDGEPIPAPSTLAQARAAAEAGFELGDGPVEAVLLVPAPLPGRTARFNITLDENLVAQIDAAASNRSAFLADAARAELRRRQAAGV